MAASGYVSEDVLTSIIPLFVVLVFKLYEICFIGGMLETKIARKIIFDIYSLFFEAKINISPPYSVYGHQTLQAGDLP